MRLQRPAGPGRTAGRDDDDVPGVGQAVGDGGQQGQGRGGRVAARAPRSCRAPRQLVPLARAARAARTARCRRAASRRTAARPRDRRAGSPPRSRSPPSPGPARRPARPRRRAAGPGTPRRGRPGSRGVVSATTRSASGVSCGWCSPEPGAGAGAGRHRADLDRRDGRAAAGAAHRRHIRSLRPPPPVNITCMTMPYEHKFMHSPMCAVGPTDSVLIMTYVADDNRYSVQPYRRCGRSGLQLPAVSLGLLAQLRRRQAAGDPAGGDAAGLRPRRHPLRPGQQLRPAVRRGRDQRRPDPAPRTSRPTATSWSSPARPAGTCGRARTATSAPGST